MLSILVLDLAQDKLLSLGRFDGNVITGKIMLQQIQQKYIIEGHVGLYVSRPIK